MRILGIDYGEKRLGVAVSDPDGTLALSLRVIDVASDDDAVDRIGDVCKETDADRVVVGYPIGMDGTPGAMARRVDAFVGKLSSALAVPVETWDERLTSQAAERTLLEADLSRGRRKRVRDKLAAQAMLQGYLDRPAPSGEEKAPTGEGEHP
jgi:putative Holliday junction resolvase